MIMLDYNRLLRQSNSVPPYRGTTNRFPIGDRKHNNKYFFVREANGKKEFDVVYGMHWKAMAITKEEYDRSRVGGGNVHAIANGYGGFEYSRYGSMPNVVGVVRDDNTFEFTNKSYSQGDHMFLTSTGPSSGWFHSDSRRGGMVFNNPYSVIFHPIWEGMRVCCDTVNPITPYEVTTYAIDRKKSRSLLSPYEHFFKVSEVMLKSIDANTLVATAKEIVDEIFDYEGGSGKYHKSAEYLVHANERLNNAPLDAFILFALSYDMGRLQWSIANVAKQGGRFTYSQTDAMNADSLFANLKRRLCKDLYKKSEDVFKPVVHMGGTKYPSCEWGVIVTVDGKEMEQYT